MKKIKKFLSSFILTKGIYKFLVSIKINLISKEKRENMHLSGVDTIRILQNFFEKQNVMFFFDMGTLLGIIREGRLLKHDLDIDTALLNVEPEKIEAIRKGLIELGCIHKFRYTVKDIGICEDSYMLNNIKFDINYYGEEQNKSVCYLAYTIPDKQYAQNEMSTVLLSCDKINNVKKIDFEGFKINVPENPEKYLSQRYGENWRIPDKKYQYWCGPSTSPISNITIQNCF